uniref:Elapor1-like galactose binding domain-containing protein n=1 Tax=Timema shepardi TaxID=629360 RepID=A0A7R9B2W1_TIMSH|nr:unnamed protein product [Timema shepardi]
MYHDENDPIQHELWIRGQGIERVLLLTHGYIPSPYGDYHYELTECDLENGRWRVRVPSYSLCADTTPSPAKRIDNCRTSPMASLVLNDSSQLTPDGFEKLPDQLCIPTPNYMICKNICLAAVTSDSQHLGISCEAGYYFDLGDLTCRMCHPGTFSLGGGVLFDTWEDLPQGFYTQVESFRSSFASAGRFTVDVNCSSRYGWQPSGDFLASLGGPCAATLTYTVHLVKPGNLSYVYQYSDKDVIFDFEERRGAGRVSSLQTPISVHPCSLLTKLFDSLTDHQAQNDQCQSIGDSKEYRWPSATRKGEWKQQTVHLKTGQNVLQWKTIGMDTHQAKPVLIKAIEISGKRGLHVLLQPLSTRDIQPRWGALLHGMSRKPFLTTGGQHLYAM